MEHLLPELLASLGRPDLLPMALLWRAWPRVVGPQLVSRCRPAGVHDGVVTVEVTSSAWLHQLQYLQDTMLRRINEELGDGAARHLRLVHGRSEAPAPRSREEIPRQRELTDEEARTIREACGDIPDPALAGALERLLRLQLGLVRPPGPDA